MGRIRYRTAPDGEELGLYGHEGYVQAELSVAPVYGGPNRDGNWTATSCNEHDGKATGRHRAACECGWRGPIVETGIRDVFLDEGEEDKIFESWEAHIEQPLEQLVSEHMAERTAVDDLRRAYRELRDAAVALSAAVPCSSSSLPVLAQYAGEGEGDVHAWVEFASRIEQLRAVLYPR